MCTGNKDTCCSDIGPCQEDEGTCTNDSECAGDLICGGEACTWESGRDSCRQLCNRQYTGVQTECCSNLPGNALCGDQEGDCDGAGEGQCQEGLLCGADNCVWDVNPYLSEDCCYIP